MAKEKSITELREEKQQLATRSKTILAEARSGEGGAPRALTTAEQAELNNAQLRMQEINLEIQEHADMNRGKGTPHLRGEKFSLRRAIANMVEGRDQNDAEGAVIAAATKEHNLSGVGPTSRGSIIVPTETRAMFTAGTESTTGVVIDQDQQEMLLPLEANLVLARAGARFMKGLKGDIYWPKYSGSNVFWAAENAKAQDGAGAISKGTIFKPMRLTAYADISEQLLIQENMSVEALIRQTLVSAITQKIEQTAFGTQSGVDNQPDGMFTDKPADKGAMSWARIVGLETNADLQNALYGNLAYIMHPALIGKAKTLVKDSSGAGGFIFGNDGEGTLNGYRALRTNNIPKELQPSGTAEAPVAGDEYGIVFGNFNDYFIGQWGGVELRVDPYTRMLEGVVRIAIASYWNMGFIRKESFSIASMK